MKSNEKINGGQEVNKVFYMMPLLRKETDKLTEGMKKKIKKQLKLQKRLNKASHQTQQNEVTNQPTPVPHQPPPPVSTKLIDEIQRVNDIQDAKQQPPVEQQQQNENDKQQQQHEKDNQKQQATDAQQQKEKAADEGFNNYINEIKKTGLKVLRVLLDEGARIPDIKDKKILIKTIKENSESKVKFPRTYYVIDSNFEVPILLVKRPRGSTLKTETLKKYGNYTMEFDDGPTPEESLPSHFVFGLPKVVCGSLYILILCHSCSVNLSSAAFASILKCMSNIKTSTIWDVGHILRMLVRDLYGVKSEISGFTGKFVHRGVQLEKTPGAAASTKVSRKRIQAEEMVQRQMEMIDEKFFLEVKESIHFQREVHFQEQIMRLSTADNKANSLTRTALTCERCGQEHLNATTKRIHHMNCCIPPHLVLTGPVISFNKQARKEKAAELKLWKNMQPSLHHEEFIMKKQQKSSAPFSSFSLTTTQQRLFEEMKPLLNHQEFEANQQQQSSSSSSSYRIIPEHHDIIVENKKMDIISNNLQQQPSTSSASSSYSIDINSSTGIQNGVTFQVFDQAEIDGLVSVESLNSDFDFNTYHNEEEDEEEKESSSLVTTTIATTTTTGRKRKVLIHDVGTVHKKINSRPEKIQVSNNIHTTSTPSSSATTIPSTTTTTPSAPSPASSGIPSSRDAPFTKSYKWKRFSNEKKNNILKLLVIMQDAVKRGGDKPFRCEVCPDSNYASFNALAVHYRHPTDIFHPQLPLSTDIIFCECCWDYFSGRESLYNHIVGNHPDIDVSNFEPFYSHAAKKVVRRPMHKCELCVQSFFTSVALRVHHCIDLDT